jgi:23S rRNA-/tRNA-specific pseudouridylate synthase
MAQFPISYVASLGDAGKRLDQYLVSQLPEISRARLQRLISEQKVLVNETAAKASLRLRGNERISILGSPQIPPLRAIPEEIPLDIVYEDDDLAKNDESHRRLAIQFARRKVKKTYVALVHGWIKQDRGTISARISRDRLRRTRMTTRRRGGREAITRYQTLRRLDTPFGKFTLLELHIDTGRTHQIRVHLASLGHPVAGDSLYGAPREVKRRPSNLPGDKQGPVPLSLPQNFLHAAALELEHPRSKQILTFSRPLPRVLDEFLARLEGKNSAF